MGVRFTSGELEDILNCIDNCLSEDGFFYPSEDRARLTRLANKIEAEIGE